MTKTKTTTPGTDNAIDQVNASEAAAMPEPTSTTEVESTKVTPGYTINYFEGVKVGGGLIRYAANDGQGNSVSVSAESEDDARKAIEAHYATLHASVQRLD